MPETAPEEFNLNIDQPGIENEDYESNNDNSPPKYLWDRKIFSLIWLAYCVSFPKLYTGTETYLTNLATRAVKKTFEDKKIQRLIGTWELVWGVSVEQRPASNVADGAMFVAKYNPDSKDNDTKDNDTEDNDTKVRYVISVAGTNPFSIFTVFFQDLGVFKTRDWNGGKPWSKHIRDKTAKSDRAAISSGASRGLKVHLTKMQGSMGELLLDFLKKEIKEIGKYQEVEITVAGHSLGGALAQILAFALKEKKKSWDKYEQCTIKVVSVGNPCFTNQKFVEKYNSSPLKDETYRFWCDMDMVPDFTNKPSQLATIYEPDIPSNILITTLTDTLRQSIKQNQYKHISYKPSAFSGYQGSFKKTYALQYINEHPELKDFISGQITSLIFLVLFRQLQVTLFVPNFIGDVVEDTFKKIAEESSEGLAQLITQTLNLSGEISTEFDHLFSRFFDAFSGIPGLGTFAQFNANLLDSRNVIELTNWFLQFSYQHVIQYEKHLEIDDFTKKMRKITKTSYKEMKYSSNPSLE